MVTAHEIQAMLISFIIDKMNNHDNGNNDEIIDELCDVHSDLTNNRALSSNDFKLIFNELESEYFISISLIEINNGNYMIIKYNDRNYVIKFIENDILNYHHQFLISRY